MPQEGRRQGRRIDVDNRIMERLRENYEQRFSNSPTRLVSALDNRFPEACDDQGTSVVSVRTVQNFFRDGSGAPRTVDFMCQFFLSKTYDQVIADFDTDVEELSLPFNPPQFWVGRREKIKLYQKWFVENSGMHMLFLLGEGGVGKTTFAEYLAYENRELFKKIIVVRVAEREPLLIETVLQDILEQIGHPSPPTKLVDRQQAVMSYFRKNRYLLILDNLDAAMTDTRFTDKFEPYDMVLSDWIDHQHRSFIIITSRIKPDLNHRARMNVKFEPVAGLPEEDYLPFFRERYLERGLENLLVDEQQIRAIQLLGNACDGHPFAMNLIAQECLEENIDLLIYYEYYGDSLSQREMTNSLIRGQFERLRRTNEKAWQLLVRLGVYRFELPVTEPGIRILMWDEPLSVCESVLVALKRRSLVRGERGGYQLHPLIAEYSRVQLKANYTWWRQAHQQAVTYWENSPPRSKTGKERVAHLLEAFWHRYKLEEWTQSYQILRKTIDGMLLGEWLIQKGFARELLPLWQALEGHLEGDFEKINCLLGIGYAYFGLGNRTRIQEIASAALKMSRDIVYPIGIIDSLALYANSLMHQNDLKKAILCYLEALRISRDLKDRKAELIQLLGLGVCYYHSQNLIDAQYYYEQALEISEKLEIPDSAATCLKNLGDIYLKNFDLENTFYYYQKALDMHKIYSHQSCIAATFHDLGRAYKLIGDFDRAEYYLQQALEICEVIDFAIGHDYCCNDLASIYIEMNRDREAKTFCDRALANEKSRLTVEVYFKLGYIHERSGKNHWLQARSNYEECIKFCQDDQTALKAESQLRLAWIFWNQKLSTQADEYINLALNYFIENGTENIGAPSRFSLTCYELLTYRQERDQAQNLLNKSYDFLMVQAARFTNDDHRNSYLNNIPANYRLAQIWRESMS